MSKQVSFEVSAQIMRTMLERVVGSTSKEDSRYTLNGIKFEVRKGEQYHGNRNNYQEHMRLL